MPTIDEIFRNIDSALREDPSRSQGTVAVFQFDIGGEEAGIYQIVMRENEAYAHEGVQETPDCTISIDGEHFKKLMTGQLNPMMAVMSGKLKIQGNLGLAMRLNEILAAYQKGDA